MSFADCEAACQLTEKLRVPNFGLVLAVFSKTELEELQYICSYNFFSSDFTLLHIQIGSIGKHPARDERTQRELGLQR